jgi:hypothetical protein
MAFFYSKTTGERFAKNTKKANAMKSPIARPWSKENSPAVP